MYLRLVLMAISLSLRLPIGQGMISSSGFDNSSPEGDFSLQLETKAGTIIEAAPKAAVDLNKTKISRRE